MTKTWYFFVYLQTGGAELKEFFFMYFEPILKLPLSGVKKKKKVPTSA